MCLRIHVFEYMYYMIYLVVHISYCIIDKKFNLAELLNFILSNKVK